MLSTVGAWFLRSRMAFSDYFIGVSSWLILSQFLAAGLPQISGNSERESNVNNDVDKLLLTRALKATGKHN